VQGRFAKKIKWELYHPPTRQVAEHGIFAPKWVKSAQKRRF
jgi:hypothetical protein